MSCAKQLQQLSKPVFLCTWESCTKMFTRKSDRSRHLRIHTNDRQHFCPYIGCGKRFIQRSALTVHQRTHTGERPYLCKHKGCNSTFSDSSSYARHRRRHTGSDRYPCAVYGCNTTFSRQSACARHIATVHQMSSLVSNTSIGLNCEQISSSWDSGRPVEFEISLQNYYTKDPTQAAYNFNAMNNNLSLFTTDTLLFNNDNENGCSSRQMSARTHFQSETNTNSLPSMQLGPYNNSVPRCNPETCKTTIKGLATDNAWFIADANISHEYALSQEYMLLPQEQLQGQFYQYNGPQQPRPNDWQMQRSIIGAYTTELWCYTEGLPLPLTPGFPNY